MMRHKSGPDRQKAGGPDNLVRVVWVAEQHISIESDLTAESLDSHITHV